MASDSQIFNVRLRIDDPAGFINFESVADTASLPADPSPQTAYKVVSTGAYVSTELTTGATPSDYDPVDLRVSDVRIGAWIDSKGEDYATCQALSAIISKIGNELVFVRNKAGAEDVEYTSLRDTLSYYKDLKAACSEESKKNNKNSTGRWGGSKEYIPGGGNL